MLTAALALALLVSSCFGPTYIVQQYKGSPRAPETIATLRVVGSEPVRLLVLDGDDVAAPIASDARLHIEMEPGRHVLRVLDANAPNEPSQTLVFDAEAGKVYRVEYVARATPRVFEVDRSSDKRGRDVTVEAAGPADVPAEGARRRRAPPRPPAAGPEGDAGVAPFEERGVGAEPSLGADGG